MNDSWNRRSFLKKLALGCGAVAGTTTGAILINDRGRNEPAAPTKAGQVRDFKTGLDLAEIKNKLVVANGDPSSATRGAIESLGGIARFVKPGERVVIKPNVGWDRTPIQAANTNPIVVGTLVELCFKAGAQSVIVTDHSCNEAARCFTRSGIWKASEAAGAQVVLPAQHRFRPYYLGGMVLGHMPVLDAAVRADRFINVPIAKHHGLSGFTGAMKNLYGVLGGRRNRLHQKIDHSIADLADFLRPTLTVMDATRVLMRNGPQGGDVGDTKAVGQIICSTDQVAVDTYACTLVGYNPQSLPYLSLAQDRNLGISDSSKIQLLEVS